MVETRDDTPPDARDNVTEKSFRERWYALFSKEETQDIIKGISSGKIDTSSVEVLFRVTNVFINDRLPKQFRSYTVGLDEARFYINYRMLPSVESAIELKETGIEPSESDILFSKPLFKILKFSEKFKSDDTKSLWKEGLEKKHELEIDESKLSDDDFINVDENSLGEFFAILNEEAESLGDTINKRKVRITLDLFARDFKKIIQLNKQLIS